MVDNDSYSTGDEFLYKEIEDYMPSDPFSTIVIY
jgi:hypothetical protein